MGKRIRVQRRGKASSTFRASTHRRIAPSKYPRLSKGDRERIVHGIIVGIHHEVGRGAPIASVKTETHGSYYTVIPEGIHEGQSIQIGGKAPIEVGNVLPLGDIPEGTMICNIELSHGDGGKIARSSGSYVTVVDHTPEGTIIRLPSKKNRYFNDLCLATIGVVSGAGRVDKPFLKAGAMFHKMRAKGHKYPRGRGVAMVAAVHPYGSSKRGARKVTTVSRHAPPGRKVGLIAARSTGRKRRKRR